MRAFRSRLASNKSGGLALFLPKSPFLFPMRVTVSKIVAILLLSPLLTSISKADTIWNVTSGDWSTATNWSTGTVPTSSTNVDIGTTSTNRTATVTTSGVAADLMYLGYNSGNVGTLNITGGSLTVVKIYAGDSGTGTMNITSGGVLFTGSVNSAFQLGSTSTITVDGTGSKFTANSGLVVGQEGNGTLTVQNKATLTTGNGGMVYIASDAAAAVGVVTVTGTGSTWTGSDTVYVGNAGNGTLNVLAGAVVSLPTMYIAGSSVVTYTPTGLVTVDGAGSQLNLSGATTYVGSLGTGTLTVQAGGSVSGQAFSVGTASGSSGTINLNGSSGSRGILSASVIQGNAGAAKINFNGGILQATGAQSNLLQNFTSSSVQLLAGGAFIDTQSYAVGISTVMQGVGGLDKMGTGTLTLIGTSTYTGTTTVEAGTLFANGTLASPVTVQSGATLAGNGTMKTVSLLSGSTIAPGAVAGTVATMNTQGQTWAGGGTYAWQLSNVLTGSPGANWDFLSLTGGLNITATPANPFTIAISAHLTQIPALSTQDWTILTASTGFGGTFAANDFILDTTNFYSSTGGTFTLITQGNNLVLQLVAAVPEPGRAALLLVGLGAVILRRRRGLTSLQ